MSVSGIQPASSSAFSAASHANAVANDTERAAFPENSPAEDPAQNFNFRNL